MSLTLSDFDFPLPAELIAQRPLPDRAASRLLVVHRDRLEDLVFADLERLLEPGDLLVINDTRVIKARLRGRRDSGGRVEAMVERIESAHRAWALLRCSHAPHPGSRLHFGGRGATAVSATVVSRQDDRYELDFDREVAATLEAIGELPLPPYIERAPDAADEERYQTVYAREPGAIAAPTAGLHFTPDLLRRLQQRGVESACVTLDVGAGTFQPVRSERIEDHRMHAERYRIAHDAAAAINAARTEGRRVIAVGTTSLRALESAAVGETGVDDMRADARIAAGAGETRLFITPGFRFRIVDRLITNFHLPKSTLVMLVAAFAGLPRIRAAYAHAVGQRYRFFSYGDAMLLDRHEP
ncbi:MAG TPA: tRNA preQ1(34) S-adenosylmethionine ribosyltransferase-isomerase QueA [Burkholderiaceae bacterium]|nr:tRNA preQ1(34) S-adenosylmethionine ribosyltransferase-isomerase QueA [Burkholderiaceae bacterium]